MITDAENEEAIDAAPEDEPEGYDDDGNELALTRRSKGRSGGRDARSKEHRGGGAKRKTSTGKGTGYRAGIQ